MARNPAACGRSARAKLVRVNLAMVRDPRNAGGAFGAATACAFKQPVALFGRHGGPLGLVRGASGDRIGEALEMADVKPAVLASD